jgi:hypothetical protein
MVTKQAATQWAAVRIHWSITIEPQGCVVHVNERLPGPLSKFSILASKDHFLDVVHNSSTMAAGKKSILEYVPIMCV